MDSAGANADVRAVSRRSFRRASLPPSSRRSADYRTVRWRRQGRIAACRERSGGRLKCPFGVSDNGSWLVATKEGRAQSSEDDGQDGKDQGRFGF